MKLTRFEKLWSAVKRYNFDEIVKAEINTLSQEGIDTDLSDVFQLENGSLYTILSDYNISRTIVYISYRDRKQIENYGYPKYHILFCDTLEQMFQNQRKHRYKKSIRYDGKFFMIVGDEHSYKELDVCQNCLKKLNQGYTRANFNLKKFINSPIETSLDGIYFEDDMDTVPMIYSKDWKKLSRHLKEKLNYTCQQCSIYLKNDKSFLHTHHINGNKTNNSEKNLKVLCIECHSNQFNHQQIKETSKYIKFMEKYKEGVLIEVF